jgi:serine/threonine protein kinase
VRYLTRWPSKAGCGRAAAVFVGEELSDREDIISELYVLEKRQSHPHIVKAFDVFLHPPPPGMKGPTIACMVMERFGRSLAKVYDEALQGRPREAGGFGPSVLRSIASGVCSALAFIHDHEFLHGDVKPCNILARWKDSVLEVRLADFGCAVLASPQPLPILF